MIPYIVLLFLTITAYVVTDALSVSIVFLLYFLFGSIVTRLCNKRPYKAHSIKIFQLSFFAYFIYALLCFIYMKANEYEYMQSFDGYSVYIPYTTQLLGADSLVELISEIYNTSHYSFVGSILVLFVYTGKLSHLFDGELYLTVQLSIMVFAAWVAVVIYRLLVLHHITAQKAYRYTMIYSLVSIHFMMAIMIVRDMPITLFYTIIIYLSFQKYSAKNVFYIIGLILLILSIRVSSGIFAFVYLFVYLFVNNYKSGSKLTPRMVISFFFVIGALGVAAAYFNTAMDTFLRNQASYSAAELADQGGDSTKAALNILPPILSELAKTVYNQVMYIPSWRRMIQTSYRPEINNVMNFPEVFATFFRYVMWLFIIVGFYVKSIRRFLMSNRMLMMNFGIALLYLLLQADTLGHRRMLGVYPIFFLIACLVFTRLNFKNSRAVFFVSTVFFLGLQLLGFLYLI